MNPNKLTLDQFEFLVDQFNLNPEYSVFLDQDDDIVINEQWSSNNSKGVVANRIYKFDSDFLNLIREPDRVPVLNEILDIYVSLENYEQAAHTRDLINYLMGQ